MDASTLLAVRAQLTVLEKAQKEVTRVSIKRSWGQLIGFVTKVEKLSVYGTLCNLEISTVNSDDGFVIVKSLNLSVPNTVKPYPVIEWLDKK